MRGDSHRAGKILAEDDGIRGSEDKGRRGVWRRSVAEKCGGEVWRRSVATTGGGKQRTADSGQRTADSGQRTVDSGQRVDSRTGCGGRRGSAGGMIGYEK